MRAATCSASPPNSMPGEYEPFAWICAAAARERRWRGCRITAAARTTPARRSERSPSGVRRRRWRCSVFRWAPISRLSCWVNWRIVRAAIWTAPWPFVRRSIWRLARDRYRCRAIASTIATSCDTCWRSSNCGGGWCADAEGGRFARPRTLWEFDDQFTAAVCGFGGADNYYRVASSGPFIPRIRIPTLILASRDDPMIPVQPLEQISPPAAVEVHFTRHGGHLGFVGRAGVDPDRRWMDWRVVDWVLARGRVGASRRGGRAVIRRRGASRVRDAPCGTRGDSSTCLPLGRGLMLMPNVRDHRRRPA